MIFRGSKAYLDLRKPNNNCYILEKITRQPKEPITRSIQLPYSISETAFSQVELFLDIKAFTQISSQGR